MLCLIFMMNVTNDIYCLITMLDYNKLRMKIKYKNILLLSVVALFLSCSSDGEKYACIETKRIDEFPKEMYLSNPENVPLDMQGCVDILAVDSLLINKMGTGTYFWKVYSLNSHRFLGRLLRKGHGRNEIANMPSSELLEKTDSALLCNFWDSSSQSYIKCNLTKSLECGQEYFDGQTKCSYQDGICNICQLDDTSFFVVSNHQYSGIVRALIKGDIKQEIQGLGNLNDYSTVDFSILSATRCINKKKGLVAEAMLRLNQINLYSLYGKEKSVSIAIDGELQKVQSVVGKPSKMRKKYFGAIKGYDNCFIALYYNESLIDYFTDKVKESDLLCFDWDGNPLLKVKVSGQVTNFFIYNKKIYVFSNSGKLEKLEAYPLGDIAIYI